MPKGMVAGRMGLWLLFGLAVSAAGAWNGELVLVAIGGFLTGVSLLALIVILATARPGRAQRGRR